MADARTLAVYAARARDYAARFGGTGEGPHVRAFLAELPKGGRILDLGCGPGHAAAAMTRAGFKVEAWDASPELVRIARDEYGVDARVVRFEDLADIDRFDGIYANFSLLHASKAEMPALLTRIARALKPQGVLHIGLKTGCGERRDAIGRFYAYYEDAEIAALLDAAGLPAFRRATGEESGLDGAIAPWIILLARKT
jgi:SAM-dependent methyltransferase